MKRLFMYIISLFLLVNLVQAFTILDESNSAREYFSLSSTLVKVKTTDNAINFTVSYINGNITKSSTYNFVNGSGQFSIINFMSSNSLTTSNYNFTITVNNNSNKIYLDIEKPDFTFLSSSINNVSGKVNLVFNAKDNYKLSKAELYKKVNSSYQFVANVTEKNNYSLDIPSAGVMQLRFDLLDKAGNSNSFYQNITIPDVTKPKITISKLTLKEGKYQLYFTVTDENLSKYELSQGSLVLSSDITGTSYSNTVNLPFESGDITFKTKDVAGNIISKTISLTSPFTNTYSSKFSKDKTFSFTSNANNCKLVSVDSVSKNTDFTKDGDKFSVAIDANTVKNYIVEFYCESGDFKEFLKQDFYYDTNPPTNVTIDIEALDTGTLKVSWPESSDGESSVNYILYRDGNKVYSGTKTKYIDEDVSYPKKYEYQLKILDKAGNEVSSNTVSKVPRKVSITLESNLLKQQEVQKDSFNLNLNTDKNSNVTIIVKNNQKEIFKKSYSTTSNGNIVDTLKLASGVNEVSILITDEFSNVKEQSYFVTYTPIVSSQSTQTQQQPVTQKVNVTPVFVPAPTSTDLTENKLDEISNWSFWLWFVFWVLVFGLVLYIAFFRRDDLVKFAKGRDSKGRKRNSFSFGEGRRKDAVLGRSLKKIKNARIERQNEREIERKRLEKEKQSIKHRSEIERRKHEDLSRPRASPVPFSARSKSKRYFNRITKDNTLLEEIKNTKSKGMSIGENLKNLVMPKKRGIESEDTLSQYLSKSIGKKSWEKSTDYVAFKNEPIQSAPPVVEDVTQEAKPKEPEKFDRLSLDDYLNRRTSKKRFFFAEKEVEKDLETRK